MSLESKFYNCLTTGLPFYLDGGKTLARVAKDLVEIASADIKYLSRDEVEHIIGSINTNEEKVQAICKLAIPDIDNEVGEPVTGKPALCPIETKDIYYSDAMLCSGGGAGIGYKPKIDREKILEVLKNMQKTYGKCFDLIEEEELSTIADEIIAALERK
jgi:hypothetical protein